jgi:hypothetical protein
MAMNFWIPTSLLAIGIWVLTSFAPWPAQFEYWPAMVVCCLLLTTLLPADTNRLWWLALGYLPLLLGLGQLAAQPPHGRWSGPWNNPNHWAALLSASGATLLALAMQARSGRERWGHALGWSAVSLCIWLTQSRAGWLNFAAGTALLVGLNFRKDDKKAFWWLAPPLGLALVAFFFGVAGNAERWRELWQSPRLFQQRWELLKLGLELIARFPLTGVGPGNLETAALGLRFVDPIMGVRYAHQTAFLHNEYLQALATWGIPCVMLAVWGLGRAVRVQSRSQPNPGNNFNRQLSLGILAGAGVQAFFDFQWHVPGLFVIYGSSLGLWLWPAARDSRIIGNEHGWHQRLLPGFLAFLSLAVLLPQDLTFWSSQHHLSFGTRPTADPGTLPNSAAVAFANGRFWLKRYAQAGQRADFVLAHRYLKHVIKLRGPQSETLRRLGELYLRQADFSFGIQNMLSRFTALAYYRQARVYDPKNAVYWFETGNIYRDLQLWPEAKEAWGQAVKLEPLYRKAWHNLRILAQLEEDPATAAAIAKRLVSLKPPEPLPSQPYLREILE